ncbi:MAG TPA: hydrogenase maturation protease [Acidimicrobiales bacterium]|nr:hydrogenase maturation protease [Acidimicrobiales bacterium]
MTGRGRIVVVGVGNSWRGDDGAGPAVAAALRGRLGPGVPGAPVAVVDLDGEAARLVDAWDGADLAVVVDAVRTGAPPGTLHRLDACDVHASATASSHALGVQHAVALARALGRLPRRLVLVGVEGADFGHGTQLSDPVAAAVEPASRLVVGVVAEAAAAAIAGPAPP